jgi:DNA adenine methylase
MIAFGYYGGKYSHLDWLLPLLDIHDATQYCEPFGGSAAVLLNRKPVHIETYNDLDGEVVNFFRVLREQREELVDQLTFTPFSRYEYLQALKVDEPMTNLERARRFYIRARQSMMAQAQSATAGRWAYSVATEGGTAVPRWINGVPKLIEVAKRLAEVQIENLPGLEVIARYDSLTTLFYVDPPYVMSTRPGGTQYSNELSDKDHEGLAEVLHRCKGFVAVSGYDSGLYRDLYADWHMHTARARVSFASQNRSLRQEVLWTNYNPKTVNSTDTLPLFSHVLETAI